MKIELTCFRENSFIKGRLEIFSPHNNPQAFNVKFKGEKSKFTEEKEGLSRDVVAILVSNFYEYICKEDIDSLS